MRDEDIAEFWRWKRNEPDTPVLDSLGDAVVDVFGNPVLCQGGWTGSNSSIKKSSGAISALHESRGQGGEYHRQCDSCRAKPEAQWHEGCRSHPGKPQVWRSGNPIRCQEITNAKQNLQDRTYQPYGDTYPTLLEFLKWRKHLVEKNTVDAYKKWLLSIMATRLFLRPEEAIDLKDLPQHGMTYETNGVTDEEKQRLYYNCFVWDMSTVIDGNLKSTGFKIWGKADNLPQFLVANRDDKVPEFDIIRSLLIYTHFAEYTSGYLFPPDGYEPDIPGYNQQHYDYAAVLADVKELGRIVERPGKWGAQSYRKNGYGLGASSGANDMDMMLAARHATTQNAALYIQDARAQIDASRETMLNFESMVPDWKSVYVKNIAMYNATCKPFRATQTLKRMADDYVTKTLGIAVGSPEHNIRDVDAAAIRHQFGDTPVATLSKLIENLPHSVNKPELLAAIDRYARTFTNDLVLLPPPMQQNRQPVLQLQLLPQPPATPPPPSNRQQLQSPPWSDLDIPKTQPPLLLVIAAEKRPIEQVEAPAINPAKKPKRGGTVDCGYQQRLKDLPTTECVGEIMKLGEEGAKVDSKDVLEGFRTFLIQQANPISACIKNHYSGDVGLFLGKWGAVKGGKVSFARDKFGTNCCKGEGPAADCGKNGKKKK
ncbi:UNVERIFIED_CONTAM: hypothetical protein HDU68_001709 [Siphonaria sp. JEL0065]|nr:hypothetical protein HDU68_001709 [Siphonaria sp. JEL0065]